MIISLGLLHNDLMLTPRIILINLGDERMCKVVGVTPRLASYSY